MTAPPDRVELLLFVSGASVLSGQAITEARLLCDEHLADGYDLTIIDIHQDPAAVARHRVTAAPTLVKTHPLPEGRVVGDLTRADRTPLLEALGLPAVRAPGP